MMWARWKVSSRGGWLVASGWLVACTACARQGPAAHAINISSQNIEHRTSEQAVPHPRLHFPTNATTLVRRDRPKVAADASWLRQAPTAAVILEGHADARGPAAANLALGDRRARAVAALLMARGVDPRQIVGILSRGETRPVRHGHHPRAWAANRRVEVLVR